MAVVTVKSLAITNRESLPRKASDNTIQNGMIRESIGVVPVTSGDSIASKYILATVPSHARLSALSISSDDLGTTTVGKLGLYATPSNGGAVAVAGADTAFGSAIVLNAGAIFAQNQLDAGSIFTIAKKEQPIWQVLGLAADPRCDYDIALVLTGACDGSGYVSCKVHSVI